MGWQVCLHVLLTYSYVEGPYGAAGGAAIGAVAGGVVGAGAGGAATNDSKHTNA